jgi:type IV secretory pathway VirB10-like protein
VPVLRLRAGKTREPPATEQQVDRAVAIIGELRADERADLEPDRPSALRGHTDPILPRPHEAARAVTGERSRGGRRWLLGAALVLLVASAAGAWAVARDDVRAAVPEVRPVSSGAAQPKAPAEPAPEVAPDPPAATPEPAAAPLPEPPEPAAPEAPRTPTTAKKKAGPSAKVELPKPSLSPDDAECVQEREQAEAAFKSQSWGIVLTKTKRTACWPAANARTSLRVTALYNTRRYAECIAFDKPDNSPRVRGLVAACREKIEEPE